MADSARDFNLGWAVEYGNLKALNQLFEALISGNDYLLDNYEVNRMRFLERQEISNEENLLSASIHAMMEVDS